MLQQLTDLNFKWRGLIKISSTINDLLYDFHMKGPLWKSYINVAIFAKGSIEEVWKGPRYDFDMFHCRRLIKSFTILE